MHAPNTNYIAVHTCVRLASMLMHFCECAVRTGLPLSGDRSQLAARLTSGPKRLPRQRTRHLLVQIL